MRKATPLILSLTLSACASHRTPAAAPDALHDWASVVAIPPGAPIRVTVNYDNDGPRDNVTDSTLTIRVPPDSWRITPTTNGGSSTCAHEGRRRAPPPKAVAGFFDPEFLTQYR
jgi:hypothetical protein